MKEFRIGLLIFLFLFIVLQFFPGDRPEVIAENPGDIHEVVEVGIPVSKTLRTACYDCHSNETDYPWYAKIVPLSWWIHNHIEEANEHLNFSVWASYSDKKRHHKLEELIEEVEEGEMPLSSYTIIHRDAIISAAEREELINWAKAYMKQIEPVE